MRTVVSSQFLWRPTVTTRIVGAMATITTTEASQLERTQDDLMQGYVKIIASDELVTVIKWMCTAASLSMAIFAISII